MLSHFPRPCSRFLQAFPELYATPWFMTLFSHHHSLDIVYTFWDRYLVLTPSHLPSDKLLLGF